MEPGPPRGVRLRGGGASVGLGLILPTLPASSSAYQRLPSGPCVIRMAGHAPGTQGVLGDRARCGDLPIFVPGPLNQRSFSGPTVMSFTARCSSGSEYSVTVPEVVIFPTLLAPAAVNQRSSFGTRDNPVEHSRPPASEYSVIVPDVVIFPILLVIVVGEPAGFRRGRRNVVRFAAFGQR